MMVLTYCGIWAAGGGLVSFRFHAVFRFLSLRRWLFHKFFFPGESKLWRPHQYVHSRLPRDALSLRHSCAALDAEPEAATEGRTSFKGGCSDHTRQRQCLRVSCRP